VTSNPRGQSARPDHRQAPRLGPRRTPTSFSSCRKPVPDFSLVQDNQGTTPPRGIYILRTLLLAASTMPAQGLLRKRKNELLLILVLSIVDSCNHVLKTLAIWINQIKCISKLTYTSSRRAYC
jgi:hypothetical protein